MTFRQTRIQDFYSKEQKEREMAIRLFSEVFFTNPDFGDIHSKRRWKC